MLVRFKSDVGGFTMFGDVAAKLLRMAGHSASVPGAIPAEEIATALANLEQALAALAPPQSDATQESGEEAVPLQRRAFPLVELLRAALREECGVMWDRA
jgi:hypothetical protein